MHSPIMSMEKKKWNRRGSQAQTHPMQFIDTSFEPKMEGAEFQLYKCQKHPQNLFTLGISKE